jgi:hypothetical protein
VHLVNLVDLEVLVRLVSPGVLEILVDLEILEVLEFVQLGRSIVQQN